MSCGNCTDCNHGCKQRCSVCLSCDATCNEAQLLCSSNQLASAYVGAATFPSFNRNDIIIEKFPRQTLNDMIDYVAKAAEYPTSKKSYTYTEKIFSGFESTTSGPKTYTHEQKQDSGGWSTSHETRDFIYADKINQLLSGIFSLNKDNVTPVDENGNNTTVSSTEATQVAKNDIIYAQFFSNISSAINELKLFSGSCEMCVTNCDVQCNTCDGCNSCQECDGCEKCDTCQSVTSYSSHYSSAPAT